MTNLHGLMGLFGLVLIAWACSENRGGISWKLITVGIALQGLLGLVFLKLGVFQGAIGWLNGLVLAVEESTRAGTSMVFGYLGGGALPFEETRPGASFILAFSALPIVLVISALSSLLFYIRVLPAIIGFISRLLEKSLKVGGAEGLGLAANIFVGMVESPLLIRPYIGKMTRSELFSVMTCGMATIAGTVMVLYASILSDAVPGVLGHILVASVISVPAAYVISKVMIPETESVTPAHLELNSQCSGPVEAITDGTIQGVRLLVNIVAMLVVMVALVHLANLVLALIPGFQQPLTLQQILGFVFAPITWLMGIPWSEALQAGGLLGTKTIINEFVAFLDLSSQSAELSPRTNTILVYALCGFANPGSLGIMIGGLTAMAPERKSEIIELSVRSVLAGTLATCMTGAVAGIFIT